MPILNPLNDSFNADLRLCRSIVADLQDIVLIVMIRPCVSDYDWNYYKENQVRNSCENSDCVFIIV